MGGGAKSSLSTLPGQSRSIVCHGLQMGTTRTSNAREADSMREVIGEEDDLRVSVRVQTRECESI